MATEPASFEMTAPRLCGRRGCGYSATIRGRCAVHAAEQHEQTRTEFSRIASNRHRQPRYRAVRTGTPWTA